VPNDRPWGVTLLAAGGVLLAGCGSTSLLTGSAPTRTALPEGAVNAYLAALAGEQTKLAEAERHLPSRPRTAAELSSSIGLLAAAIARLGNDLAAIRPPAAVSSPHAQLVAIMRDYAGRLLIVAREARTPGGELRASNDLIGSTSRASRAFTATSSKIIARLGR
jgi:hypothetical protein